MRASEMKNNKEDNMKYTTSTIDYTGCHPVIAEHLKRSEEIWCWAWDQDCHEKPNSCCEVWIVRYWRDSDYPYRTAGDLYFRHAEPIPRKVRRIMPPERAVPVLIAEGWEFTTSGELAGRYPNVLPVMFPFMGRRLAGDAGRFNWPPCIIEECDK